MLQSLQCSSLVSERVGGKRDFTVLSNATPRNTRSVALQTTISSGFDGRPSSTRKGSRSYARNGTASEKLGFAATANDDLVLRKRRSPLWIRTETESKYFPVACTARSGSVYCRLQRLRWEWKTKSRFPIRLRSEGVTFLSLLGKVVGTARKIRGFFASLRMTNKKVTASQDDNF